MYAYDPAIWEAEAKSFTSSGTAGVASGDPVYKKEKFVCVGVCVWGGVLQTVKATTEVNWREMKEGRICTGQSSQQRAH